MSGIPYLQLPS